MPTLAEVIPKELHDRPYLKDFLTMEQNPEAFGKVFSKLDGAEALIGKKVGIPAADAKDDEWNGFLSKLRPEKADDYEIPTKEGAKPDPEFIKELRESFLAGDINKRQATKFLANFTKGIEKRVAAQAAAQAKQDADFETLSKAAFGEESKPVMERVKAAISEHAPAVVKPFIDKLDNNSLVILMGVIDGIQKKYVPEDKLKPGGGNAGDNGQQTKREEAMKLMALPEYKDAFHPNHKATVDKVNAIYAEFKGK